MEEQEVAPMILKLPDSPGKKSSEKGEVGDSGSINSNWPNNFLLNRYLYEFRSILMIYSEIFNFLKQRTKRKPSFGAGNMREEALETFKIVHECNEIYHRAEP